MESGYRIVLDASPEEVWEPIARIGARTGWYFADFLWAVRGALDRFIGGVGLRRGRRHPSQVYTGDSLDFWRVLEVQRPHRLLLLAERKLPGEATLEFNIHALPDNRTELQQLSRFLPKGLLGLSYWYVLYPFNQWIFRGMLKRIAGTTGRNILNGPDRFAPRRSYVCRFNPKRFVS